MKILFIGGTLSGKSINVPNTNTYRNVVMQPKLSWEAPDIPPIEEVYHRHQLLMSKGTNPEVPIEFFLHCSIKPEHIVKLLKLSHGQEEA